MLQAKWEYCTKCDLADRRINDGYPLAFGEGYTKGIMFIGGAPSADEEHSGRPMTGASGSILRNALKRLGLNEAYFTNAVACRSCAQAHNGEGQPMFKRNGDPIIRDEAPKPPQVNACLPRVQEQIYLVDPILIVTLGGEAAKALLGRPFSVLADSGTLQTIHIPGAWSLPVISDKKKVWGRKVNGQMHYPNTPNTVSYPLLPALHPSYVQGKQGDRTPGNAVEKFAETLKMAARIYDRYMWEAHSRHPTERQLTYENIFEGEPE